MEYLVAAPFFSFLSFQIDGYIDIQHFRAPLTLVSAHSLVVATDNHFRVQNLLLNCYNNVAVVVVREKTSHTRIHEHRSPPLLLATAYLCANLQIVVTLQVVEYNSWITLF